MRVAGSKTRAEICLLGSASVLLGSGCEVVVDVNEPEAAAMRAANFEGEVEALRGRWRGER